MNIIFRVNEMPLIASEIKSFTCPEGRDQAKKSDGNGLFLLAKSNGSKLWRLRYKYAGKHQEMALGKYPTVGLADARDLAKEARLLLIQGINPMDERRERKRKSNSKERGFEAVAMRWWEQQKDSWSEDHAGRVKRWLIQDAKTLRGLSVDEIDAGHITELMLLIEKAGAPKKAPNILAVINRVFAYALAHRLTRTNPAQGLSLRDILKPLPKVKNRSAIVKPAELAQLIRDIDQTETGSFCTVEALKLIPRVFLRPKEIRHLKWDFIDFEARIIRIPPEDMKRDREHLVPMSLQVCEQLRIVKEITGYSTYVFPSIRDGSKPISKNVMTNRLRDLGYSSDVMSAHGFRSTASTILHEQGWRYELIEVQLAHLIGSATARAYNRSLYLSERKKMMQAWADYLDELANAG